MLGGPTAAWRRATTAAGRERHVRARRARRLVGCCLLALGLGLAAPAVATADAPPPTAAPGDLALVTMNGGGTAAGRAEAPELLAEQDAVLAAVGAGEPVYRWT